MTHSFINRKITKWLIGGAAAIGAASSHAAVLTYMPFDGGLLGESLADNTATGGSAVGVVADFDGFSNEGNSEYVAGLSGSQGGVGNALTVGLGGSHRHRLIIDRTTGAWVGSGLVGGDTLIGSGTTTGTLFGSYLVSNSAAPLGFTGLEFAAGNPNDNRVLTAGEAASGADFVVLGSTGSAGGSGTDLALPTITLGVTREIVFRIDYTAGVDTFTLINPDGSDGLSGTGSFEFATLHLSSFSGSPAITYDEIKLGTTLSDVTTIPEPSSTLFGVLGLLFGLTRRRRS